jgi:YhcH/YjgK/YiaL family protein
MIIDKIENAGTYISVHPAFKKAFALINGSGAASLGEGRHDIGGEEFYAVVAFPEGSGRGKARLEAHRKYIDIQATISGEDVIGWKPAGECRVISAKYDQEKDCEFFADVPLSWFTVKPGFFAVFFPEDAHAPLAGAGPLHKIVVKVAI